MRPPLTFYLTGLAAIATTAAALTSDVFWDADERTARILSAGASLCIAAFAAQFASHYADVRKAAGHPIPGLLVRIGKLLVYALGASVATALYVEGPLIGLVATSGVLSLVVGLALRNIIMDAFSGIALSMEQPFRSGEWIQFQLSGKTSQLAKVVEVGWRTTRLVTSANNSVVVPNSVMSQAVVTNFGQPTPISEFDQFVTLDADVPVSRGQRVLRSALWAAVDSGIVMRTPPPKVRVWGSDAIGIQYRLDYSFDTSKFSPSTARDSVMRRVFEQLERVGIAPPVAKLDAFQAPRPKRFLDWHDLGDRTALVRKISILSPLDDAAVVQIAETARLREIAEGETVIRQGDAGQSMFLVLEGMLSVRVQKEPGQPPLEVDMIGTGGVTGEMSLLTGSARTASIVSLTDAVVLEIGKDQISRVLEAQPGLAAKLSRKIAARNARRDAKLADLDSRARAIVEQNIASDILSSIKRFFGHS